MLKNIIKNHKLKSREIGLLLILESFLENNRIKMSQILDLISDNKYKVFNSLNSLEKLNIIKVKKNKINDKDYIFNIEFNEVENER